MTINTDLLVAAPMLQDYLVDKDTGLPLVNGLISLYKDNSRLVYKNWYYQTGAPGAYTWVALDNPLHLSSVGTIQDPNGNDVIPFYYPYNESNSNVREPYYITVYSTDENGDQDVLQFTRENFPFAGDNSSPTSQNPTNRNYILNNVYWRNLGSLDCENVTDQIIAPSQHDGYTNGDIRFIKSTTGANDDLEFSAMTATLEDDITPETMLHFQCSGTQSGETEKCIQYPISLGIKSLENVEANVVIHAQNVSGSANNYLDLYIYQYTGTGALTQPDPILIQRITLTSSFQKFVIPFIFPDAEGITVGDGGDDALFLRVRYPLSALCDINHTKPQIYLVADSDQVPDNNFDTTDEIEAIINSPRTGDYRTSLNSFYSFGWIPCDGTIGPTGSNATFKGTQVWPLYQLLWNKFANIVMNGSLYLGIYDSVGAATTYGASAIADFSANKQLALTNTLGYVIMGGTVNNTPVVVTRSGNNLTGASFNTYFTGSPILFTTTGTLPSGITTDTIYYAIYVNSTTIQVATTYDNAIAGTAVTLSDAGIGVHTVQTNIAGTYTGQNSHTITIAEMPAHTHDVALGITPNILSSGGGQNVVNTGPTTSSSTGGGNGMNLVQLSVFHNMFLKL